MVHASLLLFRQGDGTYVVAVVEAAGARARKLRGSEPRDVRGLAGLAARTVSLQPSAAPRLTLLKLAKRLKHDDEPRANGEQAAL